MAHVSHGDLVALLSRDRRRGSDGFISSDELGSLGAHVESLIIAPAKRSPQGGLVYPPSFQLRCLFRIGTGDLSTPDAPASNAHTTANAPQHPNAAHRAPVLYGQQIFLVHVNTNCYLTAVSKEEVQLMPTRGPGCFFVLEPRYKLRSEGEKIGHGDNLLLHSRRFAGSYLRVAPPVAAEQGERRLSSRLRQTASLSGPSTRKTSLVEVASSSPSHLELESSLEEANRPMQEAMMEDEMVLLEQETSSVQRVSHSPQPPLPPLSLPRPLFSAATFASVRAA
ncbi:MAG: hypothetical protein SGPRY_014072 [Prymnesium sp.]